MSDPKEPLALDQKDAALVGFEPRDFERFVKRARKLRSDLPAMEGEISESILVHMEMLDELTRRLAAVASKVAESDLESALKTLTVMMKAHEGFRELVTPISRKLGERLRAQKRERVTSGDTRKALPSRSGCRPDPGHGAGNGRGTAGSAGPDPDPEESGSTRAVEAQLLGLPDGRGPGHGGTRDPNP